LPYLSVGYSTEPVVIEFFYYKPPCPSCKAWTEQYEIYEHNSQVADDIQTIHGQRISVERIYFYSEKGQMKHACMFCLGAVIPFIGIGVFAGSISKLARSAYRHRFEIRAISGLILISYALYLTIFYLIPTIR